MKPARKLQRREWVAGKLRLAALILSALMVSVPLAAASQVLPPSNPDTRRSLQVHDPLHLGDAIRKGDLATLDEVLSKSIKPASVAEIYHWFALAGKARIQGNLTVSSRNARKCYESATAHARKVPNFLVFSLSCGELLAGNYLLQAKPSKWATTLLKVTADNRKAIDLLEKQTGMSDERVLGLVDFDLEAYSKLPDVVVKPLPHRVSILPRVKSDPNAYVSDDELRQLPYVSININGHPVVALLDTGTSLSILPRTALSRLQLHGPELNYFDARGEDNGAHVRSTLVIAKHVQIGDVKLENVPFGIIDSGPALIGLDVLTRLAPFLRMSNENVYLYASPPDVACKDDLYIQSLLLGPMTLALQQHVRTSSGVRPRRFFLDTGMNVQVLSTLKPLRGSAVELSLHWMSGLYGTRARPIGRDTMFLMVDGYPHELDVRVDPTLDLRNVYGLGGLILQDFDLGLDFVHHKGCLLPKSRPEIRHTAGEPDLHHAAISDRTLSSREK